MTKRFQFVVCTLAILAIASDALGKSRYQALLPYHAFLRMARMVFNGRDFVDDDAENEFRRQHRANPVNKEYIHPRDRFVGVTLVGLVVTNDMITNFTHQEATGGTSLTITLPASAFTDGDYTVTWGFNTFPGGVPASSPIINIPDVTKAAVDFVFESDVSIPSGTTIDFHVKSR